MNKGRHYTIKKIITGLSGVVGLAFLHPNFKKFWKK